MNVMNRTGSIDSNLTIVPETFGRESVPLFRDWLLDAKGSFVSRLTIRWKRLFFVVFQDWKAPCAWNGTHHISVETLALRCNSFEVFWHFNSLMSGEVLAEKSKRSFICRIFGSTSLLPAIIWNKQDTTIVSSALTQWADTPNRWQLIRKVCPTSRWRLWQTLSWEMKVEELSTSSPSFPSSTKSVENKMPSLELQIVTIICELPNPAFTVTLTWSGEIVITRRGGGPINSTNPSDPVLLTDFELTR